MLGLMFRLGSIRIGICARSATPPRLASVHPGAVSAGNDIVGNAEPNGNDVPFAMMQKFMSETREWGALYHSLWQRPRPPHTFLRVRLSFPSTTIGKVR